MLRQCSRNPPVPDVKTGCVVLVAYEKLGWYWWPTEHSIMSHSYRGRPACDNRGWCTFGCPQRSLSTADLTYWPGALENGVDLRTHARVREIVLGSDGRAAGARYYDEDGVVREARAAVTVVACGGLGTPRLLLMSASPSHPALAPWRPASIHARPRASGRSCLARTGAPRAPATTTRTAWSARLAQP